MDDDEAANVAADDPTPLERALSGAEARAIGRCVDTLEAGPKQAITLAFFHGLSHAELARHLRQPLGG
ncbi:MAG TPA: sigma factor-like helix-turn-helix DNA-binding protein [Casimicrobiaceae bacterium]|nr:sigma factor-like helix-turn-helix DNA-binding protein [Casimicrobiaceae bacterium]